MALVEQIQEKSFLGAEFATWLWFHSEKSRGAIEIAKGKTCEVDFEGDLVLVGDYGETTTDVLRGDAPTLSPEAAAALLAGKKVKRARIRVTLDNRVWSFALNAQSFDWSGLRVEVPSSLSFEESVPLRLRALEDFHQIFETLFSRFLDLRLDAERWSAEEKRMRQWAAGKAAAEGTSD